MPPKARTEGSEISREGEILVGLFALMVKNGSPYLQELTQLWSIHSGQPKNYNSVKTCVRPWIALAKELIEKQAADTGDDASGDGTTKVKSAAKGRKKGEAADLKKVKTGRVTKGKKTAVLVVEEEEDDDCDILGNAFKEEGEIET